MSTIALRGPERVVIRQHRWTLWTVGVLTLAGIAAVVAAYLWMASASDTFANSGCSVENTVRGCGDTVRHFLDAELRFGRAVDYADLVMMLLPPFVGMFVAGPLIGRELESGTYKLSWSQSVSPARWLAAKLAVPGVLTLAGVSVLSAVSAWARSRTAGTHYPTGDWYERQVYGAMGTVPVGYALLMLAFGSLAGLLLRRTVAAMIATVVGYGVLVVALNNVRIHLWPVRTITYPVGGDFRFPDSAAVVGQGWLTSGGTRLSSPPTSAWTRPPTSTSVWPTTTSPVTTSITTRPRTSGRSSSSRPASCSSSPRSPSPSPSGCWAAGTAEPSRWCPGLCRGPGHRPQDRSAHPHTASCTSCRRYRPFRRACDPLRMQPVVPTPATGEIPVETTRAVEAVATPRTARFPRSPCPPARPRSPGRGRMGS